MYFTTLLLATPAFATPAFATQPGRADEASAPHADATAARSRTAERVPVAREKPAPPPAALLEYLGEFDDAADGLDAMGLADPDTSASTPTAGDKERQ